MAQPSVASFFQTRKRPAVDDISSSRNKVFLLDTEHSTTLLSNTLLPQACESPKVLYSSGNEGVLEYEPSDEKELKAPLKLNRVVTQLTYDNVKILSPTGSQTTRIAARSKRVVKHLLAPDIQNETNGEHAKAPNLVPFIKKGNLSPVKSLTPTKDARKIMPPSIFTNKSNIQNCMNNQDKNLLIGKNISLNEINGSITRSSRLAKLRASASMAKLNSGMDKLQEMENKRLGIVESKNPSLKEFKSIQLEVPISPQKVMASPQKTFLSPHKVSANPLMSPKKGESVARKLLLSPTKSTPAYQRYQGLAESGIPRLTLPYNYKCLAELFRSVDAVCAMLHNRKETITFNKLKPAVQEMMRKNFAESHLAQIKTIYPDAYTFSQEKVRNFGSTSKQDKYELVIAPNVVINAKAGSINADNVMKSGQETSMNPQVMLIRQRKFYNSLLDIIKTKHEEFLTTLDPPLSIPKDKLTRWHENFDVGSMPDVERAELPQAPNIEKLSSAKDVLSKAKNLFSCNTRMERALERLAEATAKGKPVESLIDGTKNIDIEPEVKIEVKSESSQTEIISTPVYPVNPALKGVPPALLEKVRANQAAKALEAMTRSAVQDQEALKYGRLPELARHARNLYVTEKKGVLPLETVLKKLGNSYKANLNPTELEEHLKLLSQLLPGWIVFHDISRGIFVKLSRDSDMTKVQKKLEMIAAEKAK